MPWQQPWGGQVALDLNTLYWFSPYKNEDSYKIHINAEKHQGFGFLPSILPLNPLVYEASGVWRCTPSFCALQKHLCFTVPLQLV